MRPRSRWSTFAIAATVSLSQACRHDRGEPVADTTHVSGVPQQLPNLKVPSNLGVHVDTLAQVTLPTCALDLDGVAYPPQFLVSNYPADTSAPATLWDGSEGGDTVDLAIHRSAPAADSTILFAWLAPRGPSPDSLPFLLPIDSLGAWYRVPGELAKARGANGRWRVLARTSIDSIVGWGGLHDPPWRELTRLAAAVWFGQRCASAGLAIHLPV